MLKFRKATNLVIITARGKGTKKEKFEKLKNAVKKMKQRMMVEGEVEGLNRKYEIDLALEKQMQEMYNARYERN